jgi:hydroxymethylglutaryl-CoA synthase
MIGIVGYGVAIPMRRIGVREIARVWGKEGKAIEEGLGIKEKAVAAWDEDSCTLAVEAARRAIDSSRVDPEKIDAVFVGSESKPYAVKPTASIVADAVKASPRLTAADFEFACKAGTTAVQCCMGFVESGRAKYGLAIGTDTAQAAPNDALEYSAGSGSAAFIIGQDEDKVIAEIEDTYSYTTDTPDFWRRQHAEFPRHGGRFTGEPAYFKHVVGASKGLLEKIGAKPADFDYAVFHQPNAKFPVRAAKLLGFDASKLSPGLVTPVIGNTYSAASLIGLAAVLDVAKPGQRIFLCSFGSGAGSDAFSLKVTKHIERARAKPSVAALVARKEHVDYSTYVKLRKKLKNL